MHFYLIVTRSCKKNSKARSHKKMLGDVKISLNLSQLKATDFFTFIFG